MEPLVLRAAFPRSSREWNAARSLVMSPEGHAAHLGLLNFRETTAFLLFCVNVSVSYKSHISHKQPLRIRVSVVSVIGQALRESVREVC